MKRLDGKVALVTGGARGIGPMGDPAAMADPCVSFASDKARYITAQTLNMDGGNWMS